MKKEEDVTFKGLFLPFTNKKAITFIFLIGIIVFFNGLFNGFVGDDDVQIVKNLNVHSIFNIPQFFASSTFYNGSSKLMGVYYKPMLTSFFAAIYTFFGPNAFMFHLVQILMHILNASLLFLFLNKFFKRTHSFYLSLIFLVHPFLSEAVFYVSALQDTLFFFFGIIAMNVLIRITKLKQLIIVFLLLLLSLFSKETGILFMGVSLMYVLFFNRKILLKFFAGSVFIFSLYLALRIYSIGLFTIATSSPIDKLSLPLRLLNAPEIVLFYFRNFFFPFNFALTYQWVYTSFIFNHFFLPLIVDLFLFGVIAAFGVFLFKKNKKNYFTTYLFFAYWFLVGLLLHLQIFPLDQTVADRWFYFPIVGLLGLIAIIFENLNFSFNKKWILVILLLVLTLLSARTIIRSFDWYDSLTLYTHDVKVSPDSFSLQNVLGLELMKLNKLQEAKIHVEKSIELYPYFSNYDNLGEIYVGLGEYKNAQKAYLNSLKFGDYYIVYEDLAGLSLVYGSPEANMKFIAYGLSKFPKDAKLWMYLAIIAYQNNYTDLAKKAIIQSYVNDKTNPSLPGIYNSIMNNKPLDLQISKYPKQ